MKRRRAKQPVFRDGKVHVCAEMCSTCIFRPGNLMELRPGRVKDMVDSCKQSGGVIPCHCTLGGEQAICRGFFELRVTSEIQVAERLGYVVFVESGDRS